MRRRISLGMAESRQVTHNGVEGMDNVVGDGGIGILVDGKPRRRMGGIDMAYTRTALRSSDGVLHLGSNVKKLMAMLGGNGHGSHSVLLIRGQRL